MIKGIPQTGPVSSIGKQSQQHETMLQTSGNAKEPSLEGDPSTPLLSHEKTSLSTDKLNQLVKNTPEVDVEKVSSIKNAILQGEYPLDARNIAKAFLALESSING